MGYGGLRISLADAAWAPITIDYPEDGSIFPPDMAAPFFVWRDAAADTAVWRIEIAFPDGSAAFSVKTKGERRLHMGEIDPCCVGLPDELPKLTAREASARGWRPDARTWAAIKSHAIGRPAIVTVTGLRQENAAATVSRGQVTMQISQDPVGAPIFYRDVPLRLPGEAENGRKPVQPPKGVMQPLPLSALPLVAWRLRDIAEPESRLLLQGLPVCANCHSFPADGKTLAMDLDGPMNDKGLYAIVPIQPRTSIRSQDVIEWSSFRETAAAGSRVGFLSRISPDGQYVVTTVKRMDFVANYADYRFLQVAYPTRGVLAWYNRQTGEMHLLPGADDPRYVHVDAAWSPDGQSIVFARAAAKDAYREDRKIPEYAGDPNETRIQYDLYRIPFNGGKGGQAEPVAGASHNGMSNNFPKTSPDGRWIVFVQCRNGQFLRPDSQLYIVPSEGGQARRMRCNTPLMNSWHSFSPNGRWLVFSSKGRSAYTQLFLTHLDDRGNDSPAILIENSTAANRAANLPEFVNIPADGLLKIDVPAAEVYGVTGRAMQLMRNGQYDAAIAEYEKALKLAPGDPQVHNNLAFALAQEGRLDDAMTHFRKVLEMNPKSVAAHNNLGNVLQALGRIDEAIAEWQASLQINPDSLPARDNLAGSLYALGRFSEAVAHWRAALRVDPNRLAGLRQMAWALATCPDAAVRNGSEAVKLAERARQLSAERDPAILSALAAAYAETGRFQDAVETARRALALAAQQNAHGLTEVLGTYIQLYERGVPLRETPRP
jgi:tetratricopeptide (TPR) repeat protein